MGQSLIDSNIVEELRILRDKTLPRYYDEMEKKFNMIMGSVQIISDKIVTLDKDYIATKIKVDMMVKVYWTIFGIVMTGIATLFFGLLKFKG